MTHNKVLSKVLSYQKKTFIKSCKNLVDNQSCGGIHCGDCIGGFVYNNGLDCFSNGFVKKGPVWYIPVLNKVAIKEWLELNDI